MAATKPETGEEQRERKLRELEGKNISFYSTMLQAWVDAANEFDRTLITLSSAAIGLLFAILTSAGVPDVRLLWFYLLAFIFFISTIGICLYILSENRKHFEKALGKKITPPDLAKFDKAARIAFILGGVFLVVIAIWSALSMNDKEPDFTPPNQLTNSTAMNEDREELQNKQTEPDGMASVQGVGDLSPENTGQGTGDADKED